MEWLYTLRYSSIWARYASPDLLCLGCPSWPGLVTKKGFAGITWAEASLPGASLR